MSDDFWKRRYDELRERWNATVLNPDAMRRDRDMYLSKTVHLKAENQRLREALAEADRLLGLRPGVLTARLVPSEVRAVNAAHEVIQDARAAVGEE